MSLREYIRLIRVAQRMRGSGGKRVLDVERDVRTVSRQSLVAARDIAMGQLIGEHDLTVQRPGTGIPASALPSVVGRRSGQYIRAGEMLTWRSSAMPRKTICFVTGTRAEFGLMRSVLESIRRNRRLKLQIVATGMHLSHRHGRTIQTLPPTASRPGAAIRWPRPPATRLPPWPGFLRSCGPTWC